MASSSFHRQPVGASLVFTLRYDNSRRVTTSYVLNIKDTRHYSKAEDRRRKLVVAGVGTRLDSIGREF